MAQAMIYPDSYYAEEAAALIDRAPSGKSREFPGSVDVIIIGGGFAGLTCALELARSGMSAVLFEARKIGWGASGRNGGFVSAGFAQGLPALISKLGYSHATALFSLSHQGGEYVRRKATAIDPGIIDEHGGLSVSRHPDPGAMAKAVEIYAGLGIETRHIPRTGLRHMLKSDRYFEALENRQTFSIQPLAYALGLARKAREAGVQIFEDCAPGSLMKTGSQRGVTVHGKAIKAPHVVLAGSAYMSGLYPRLERAVLPVATYVITTQPMSGLLDTAIDYPGCISDTRRAGDYYRRLRDGRLLWGGRITTRRSEPTALAQMLKKDILEIYPQLGNFEISHAWSGLMGYAIHKMPIISELEPGLWCATAFGGHGLNTTAMAGQLIASAITQGDDRWRQFSPFGPAWAGGVIGRAGTQAAYWLMQGCDWLEEKSNRGRGG